MKCKYCGNNLNIDDAFCPFCGQKNEQVTEHQNAKAYYEQELSETAGKIRTQKSKFGGRIVRLIIIAVLVAACIVLIAVESYMSDFDRRYNKMYEDGATDVAEHADEYEQTLQELIQNREYLKLYHYASEHFMIRSDSNFDEYYSIMQCTTCYVMVFDEITQMVDQSPYYESVNNKERCNNIATAIANEYNGFKAFSSQDKYYLPQRYTEKKVSYIDDLRTEITDIVEVYFHLSQEERDALWDESVSEQELSEMLYSHLKEMGKE